jgi:HD superfamily phosphohydrolase
MMTKVIRDPLHGYIAFDALARAIIDTVEMQRLRRIRQLGFSYLVYPGANHTRFEHSLGTYHLMTVVLDRLAVAKGEEQELLVASLIHDVGHGPYSHVTEPLIRKYTGQGHEQVEAVLFPHEADPKERRETRTSAPTIADVIEEHHLDRRKILSYIKGERPDQGQTRDLSKILNGEIDVDKMDYLVRDSYYTGVAYGVVDNIRLIRGLDFCNHELVITEKGIPPAEYLLFSRFLMHPTVYNHHTSRIAQVMFTHALEAFVHSQADASPKEYAQALRAMDDAAITTALRTAGGYPQELMRRIDERRLFKRAVYVSMSELEPPVVAELRHEQRLEELAAEISARAGVADRYVLLDVQKPKKEELEVSAATVLLGNELKRLQEVSSLVAMLSHEFEKQYKVGVYTPEEYRTEVKRAADAVLWG